LGDPFGDDFGDPSVDEVLEAESLQEAPAAEPELGF
jgi:hypothetical protein